MNERMIATVLCALMLGLFPKEATTASAFSAYTSLLSLSGHSEKKGSEKKHVEKKHVEKKNTKTPSKNSHQQAAPKQKGTAAKSKTSTPQSAKANAKQLEKLRKDIERDRTKLREVKQKERQVSTKLQQYRQKDERINGSLQKLNTSLARVQDSLRNATQRITTLSARSALLRREYADLAYTVSRSDAPDVDEMLIGTASMQEAALMEGTMKYLSKQAFGRIHESETRRDSLAQAKERLAAKRDEAAERKAQQEAEKNKVQSAIQGKKEELKSVQANKQELIRRLEERNASARKLENMIGSLVSKAEGGSKPTSYMQRNANKGDDNSAEQASSEARAASARGGFRRHALPWPTENRTIVHKFGRYTNPSTGTLIENLGIGIGSKSGSGVRAVAGGVVSLVNWLPGYGSLVIVDHGNTFRTVYANLASVSIQQGQTVKAGTLLGRSGRSVDGEYLHFELWHDRDKLNPASWLE
jgi:septal ring factor EnvC (AmiA/AmiB activator)